MYWWVSCAKHALLSHFRLAFSADLRVFCAARTAVRIRNVDYSYAVYTRKVNKPPCQMGRERDSSECRCAYRFPAAPSWPITHPLPPPRFALAYIRLFEICYCTRSCRRNRVRFVAVGNLWAKQKFRHNGYLLVVLLRTTLTHFSLSTHFLLRLFYVIYPNEFRFSTKVFPFQFLLSFGVSCFSRFSSCKTQFPLQRNFSIFAVIFTHAHSPGTATVCECFWL